MQQLKKDNLKIEISKLLQDNNYSFEYNYTSSNVEDTILLAKTFANYLKCCDIIVLNGELGAGKTVFMSGIASYFKIEDQVSSPTFTIVNEYTLNLSKQEFEKLQTDKIFHFDVYRVEDSNDFLDSIGQEYFLNGICIIEWGNIIQDILPKNTIFIDISKDEENYDKRHFKIWRK